MDLAHGAQVFAEDWCGLYKCPVVSTGSLAFGLETSRTVHRILSAGRRRIIDDEGIDWWELMSLLLAESVFAVLALESIRKYLSRDAEVWTASRDFKTRLLDLMLGRKLPSFDEGLLGQSMAARANRYLGLLRSFSLAELTQIALDKYDPAYRWRARFAPRSRASEDRVVLVPSAYANVSRMAAEYAQLLPEQRFLLVATRQSARQFEAPPNFLIRDLSAYVTSASEGPEYQRLMDAWERWCSEMRKVPELALLLEAGVMNSIPERIRHGLQTRDAWRNVLETEPVCGVFCGDDSNLYTRVPVQLASRRGIPTVDFHHGALDGRYMLKDLPSDFYVAKNDMERDYLLRVCGLPAERVVIGSPPAKQAPRGAIQHRSDDSAVFFSEPYEVAGMRAEDVYRQILPRLCQLARENDRRVIVKLHPFESLAQRKRMVERILSAEDRKVVSLRGGPLTDELLGQAWFGLTVESTTVIQCLQNGICCFLCGWFSLSPYGYGQQYARFGVGEILESATALAEIPYRVEHFKRKPKMVVNLTATAQASDLRSWLTHVGSNAAVRLPS